MKSTILMTAACLMMTAPTAAFADSFAERWFLNVEVKKGPRLPAYTPDVITTGSVTAVTNATMAPVSDAPSVVPVPTAKPPAL